MHRVRRAQAKLTRKRGGFVNPVITVEVGEIVCALIGTFVLGAIAGHRLLPPRRLRRPTVDPLTEAEIASLVRRVK
jgi:hypothetical protein